MSVGGPRRKFLRLCSWRARRCCPRSSAATSHWRRPPRRLLPRSRSILAVEAGHHRAAMSTRRSVQPISFHSRRAAGLRPTICTAGQRCRIISRLLARPLKRRFPCFTQVSPWQASSYRPSRRPRFPRAPVCARRLRISISISGRPTFYIPARHQSAEAKVSTTGRRRFGRTSGLPNLSISPVVLPYSPNVSNTGAWGAYAAGGVGVEVPGRFLPLDIAVSFTGGGGYSWFGNQSPQFGGFALPAYLNWQFGVTFTRKVFNLDLRYYDTNLSRENCFVLTGDPNARPGGAINPDHQSGGSGIKLVQRHFCREGLVRSELRSG